MYKCIDIYNMNKYIYMYRYNKSFKYLHIVYVKNSLVEYRESPMCLCETCGSTLHAE